MANRWVSLPEQKRKRIEFGKRIGAVGDQAIARVEIKGRGFWSRRILLLAGQRTQTAQIDLVVESRSAKLYDNLFGCANELPFATRPHRGALEMHDSNESQDAASG